VVQTVTINGMIGNGYAYTGGVYVFAGPYRLITTTATQNITGTAAAPLGITGATPLQVVIGLCYQPQNGGEIKNFAGGLSMAVKVTNARTSHSVAGSIKPGAGTWKVGFCLMNPSATPLDDNDYVNGWFMVTE
jgi:hypothetical protein